MIVLGKIGRMELLLDENRKVLVPDAVAEEIGNGPLNDPARQALADGWNNGSVAVTNDPAVIEWGLGKQRFFPWRRKWGPSPWWMTGRRGLRREFWGFA